MDLIIECLEQAANLFDGDVDIGERAGHLFGHLFPISACSRSVASQSVGAIGPLTDRFGRRSLILIGLVGNVLTSFACALMPSFDYARESPSAQLSTLLT